MRRTPILARPFHAVALSLAAVAALGVAATPAEAQRERERKDDKKAAAAKGPQASKGFAAVYTDIKAALDAAAKREDVVAAKARVSEAENALRTARGRPAQDAARANLKAAQDALAGLLGAEKAKVDNGFTKVVNEGDRYYMGQLAINYGTLAADKAMQRRGVQAMIDSGHVAAADLGRFHYFAGSFAYDLQDYAGAETSLRAAMAAGNTSNDVVTLLVEAQNQAGRPADALATLRQLVNDTVAAGKTPEFDWFERGVLIAYDNKMGPESVEWALRRIEFHPNAAGWIVAGQIIREKGDFPGLESLDISRAIAAAGALRTNTQPTQREYIEYLQNAVGPVGVRYPGEVLKVGKIATESGILQASDPFVRDAMAEANRRLAEDRKSLPGLEASARAANATLRTTMIGADTLLSYDMDDKAAELYQLALAKPGADASLINLRLGMALAKAGRGPEAEAVLAKVDGPRKPIAQLWTLVAKGKVVPAS